MHRGLLVIVLLAACGQGGGVGSDGGADDAPDARPAELAEIHFVGRFDLGVAAGPRFAWPGSSIRTRFDGTTLTVRLDEGGANHYDVTVDGVTGSPLVTSGGAHDHVLASGLADAEHDLVLTRRSESFFGTTQFLGFSGAPLVETAGPTRVIELVGDSITCGYGVLGTVATCPFSIDTEAETHAWGALAAADLDAVNTAIAYSGKGVYRNYGGNTTEPMPVLFERAFADDAGSVWGFATPPPDVVVINLGTNDFSTGDPGQPFVDAYGAFVTQVRGHYPDAWIVLAESPMLGAPDHAIHAGYLATVAGAAGGEAAKVTTLAVAVQLDSDGYGCDYHPNEVTQQKMAAVLVTKLRALRAW